MNTKDKTKKKRKSLRCGGDVLWVGPDLYITALEVDREMAEIWVARDSTGLSARVGTVLRDELKRLGLSGCLSQELRKNILEKANQFLTTDYEWIYMEGDLGFAFDYDTTKQS